MVPKLATRFSVIEHPTGLPQLDNITAKIDTPNLSIKIKENLYNIYYRYSTICNGSSIIHLCLHSITPMNNSHML